MDGIIHKILQVAVKLMALMLLSVTENDTRKTLSQKANTPISREINIDSFV